MSFEGELMQQGGDFQAEYMAALLAWALGKLGNKMELPLSAGEFYAFADAHVMESDGKSVWISPKQSA